MSNHILFLFLKSGNISRKFVTKKMRICDKNFGQLQREVEKIEQWINNYPRRIFDYRTSEQLFEEELRKAA